jgi:hypothetical protein
MRRIISGCSMLCATAALSLGVALVPTAAQADTLTPQQLQTVVARSWAYV